MLVSNGVKKHWTTNAAFWSLFLSTVYLAMLCGPGSGLLAAQTSDSNDGAAARLKMIQRPSSASSSSGKPRSESSAYTYWFTRASFVIDREWQSDHFAFTRGAAFIESDGDRFVYLCWSKPTATPQAPQGCNAAGAMEHPWLLAAAGFDGSQYWYARFPNARQAQEHKSLTTPLGDVAYTPAERIVIFDDVTAMKQNIDGGVSWYKVAPLHGLLFEISCDSLESEDVAQAIRQMQLFQEISSRDRKNQAFRDGFLLHSIDTFSATTLKTPATLLFSLDKDEKAFRDSNLPWVYGVALDDKFPGIARCNLDLVAGFTGRWTLPVRMKYSIIRDRKYTINESLFDATTLTDDETKSDRIASSQH